MRRTRRSELAWTTLFRGTPRLHTPIPHPTLFTALSLSPPRAVGFAHDTLVATLHAPYNPHNHH